MPSSLIASPTYRGNGVALITQDDLRTLKEGQTAVRQQQSLREAITAAIVGGTTIEMGQLFAQIVATPTDWTFQSISELLTVKERLVAHERAPAEDEVVLTVRSQSTVHDRGRRPLELVPRLERIVSQEVLAQYISLISICRTVDARRDEVIRLLGKRSPIEPGDLSLTAASRSRRHFSRRVFEKIFGGARYEEIAQRCLPRFRRHLVICDGYGNFLGWHEHWNCNRRPLTQSLDEVQCSIEGIALKGGVPVRAATSRTASRSKV